MCGLTGFVDFAKETTDAEMTDLVRRMADTLVHRGPDDSGVWVDAGDGIALGFRRLSILDLSPTGHQPMCSADGRYVIVFNGEIYNHRELREELSEAGGRFRGRSDTEVILEAVSIWGFEAAVLRLWGMFALAIWDRSERTLLLARDRIGKKPLYFGQFAGTLLFGSELKSLRAHPGFRAAVDMSALALYVRYGYVPAPKSIFQNVFKLPPGHLAVVRSGEAVAPRPYWEAREIVERSQPSPLHISERDAVDELDRLLRDSVGRRMIADVPLGALLSGGIDSSTVVALMQAQSGRPVRTFTIGFNEGAYNEAGHAKAVAGHLRTDHTELYVTPKEAQAVIPRLPDLYDEPFADSSQIPTFLVCQLARREVTVSLSGDGGDELFAGYSRYLWGESIWRWSRRLPRPLRRSGSRMVRVLSPDGWKALYSTVAAAVPRRWRQEHPGDKLYKLGDLMGESDEEGLYQRLVSAWKVPEEVVAEKLGAMSPLFGQTLPEGLATFTERMMYRDLVTYLPDDILVKVDRASMGVGLEARCPLLDHRVVEWVWKLPLDFKTRNGTSKWLLRQVLDRYVPASLVDRPKMGFGVPIDSWLRGPLREWAEALLNANRLRQEGFFRPEPVRKVWADHLRGGRNEQDRLWTVLMFQAWKERWLG